MAGGAGDGDEGPLAFGDLERRLIVHGHDEIDLVTSGLRETMIGAHQQIRDLARRDPASPTSAPPRSSASATNRIMASTSRIIGR